MYFIIIDIVDALVECYKWFAFNIIYCCKKQEQLVLIESTVAGRFGMSRMNWISFKKQRRIAQLFFETIPQATLQVLLFFNVIPGKQLTGITDRQLQISIATAAFNSAIQIFKLYAEAIALEESFVRYSLDNITARYSWVPFIQKIHNFYNNKSVSALSKTRKYLGIKIKSKGTVFDVIKVNYKIKYRYPLITWMNSSLTGSVEYDFSSVSIETLIAVLKSYRKRNITNDCKLQIHYGESLRLLGIRDIIKLMQTCAHKNIILPDITSIDWRQAFNNDLKQDTRLFSNHFDDANRPLLISLYLTQYDNKQFHVLKAFISEHDVPVNVQDDDGNTIVHHMIRTNDMIGLNALFEALKFNERLHLSEVNNAGETAMYLALRRDLKILRQINAKTKAFKAAQDVHVDNTDETKEDKEDIIEMKHEDIDELVEFQKHWMDAVHNIEENRINPATLINILYLKLNRMRMNKLRNCKSNIDYELYIQYLKSKLIVLYKEFNDIMSKKGSDVFIVSIPKAADIFAEKTHFESQDEVQGSNDNILHKLMHIMLLKRNTQINGTIYNNQTVLGFVLLNFIEFDEYINIVNYLLNEGAQLLPKEIHLFASLFMNAASSLNCDLYLRLYSRVMEQNSIMPTNIVDTEKNNPLHIVIIAKKKNALSEDIDTRKYVQIVRKLAERYPEWMIATNNAGEIPLMTAIHLNDIDAVLCLFKMITISSDIATIINKRAFVESMINFGIYILISQHPTVMNLLLKCFDYFEIFFWPKTDRNMLSLIRTLAESGRESGSGYTDQVLFGICSLNRDNHETEFPDRISIPSVHKRAVKHTTKRQQIDDIKEDEEEVKIETESDQDSEDGTGQDQSNVEEIELEEATNWLEVLYSTIVESFSTLDLCTDIIILSELYKSDHMWWSSWMLMLLLAPYLVSYGSLATMFQQINAQYAEGCCRSFFILLMMTPLSLCYLVMIDLIFMVYALLSTAIFLVSCTMLDIRDVVDKYVFQNILNMNRTEVVGYRRMRTLSQLFFETIPQIFLQMRILWQVRWVEHAEFDINENTLFWSIGLAVTHLIVESGIIYLDSKALRMSFMEYSMVCLGGRIQWIPFQHLLKNVVRKQIYIYYDIDDENNFDAKGCSIGSLNLMDGDTKDAFQKRDKQLLLDYECISADFGHFKYPVTYQFSVKSMQKLSERLTNCPPIQIPNRFNFNVANLVLQNLIRTMVCRATIHLGYVSCGNIDIYALCGLYEAGGLDKIKIDINSINERTRKKIVSNTRNKSRMSDVITKSLIHFGEIGTIKWIYKDYKDLDHDHKFEIMNDILENCLSLDNDAFIRVDILRNCYYNDTFIGRDCRIMQRITSIINQQFGTLCRSGCVSSCFAVVFILLYSKGNVFYQQCIHGCCKLDDNLKTALEKYIPSHVEIDKMKVPFSLFESCRIWKHHVEEVLSTHYKYWMVSSTQNDVNPVIPMTLPKMEQYHIDAINTLLQQNPSEYDGTELPLYDMDFVNALKLFNKYDYFIKNTMQYRNISDHTFEVQTNMESGVTLFVQDIAPNERILNHLSITESTIIQVVSMEIIFNQIEFMENVHDEKEEKKDDSGDDNKMDVRLYIGNEVNFLDDVYLVRDSIDVHPNTTISIPLNSGLAEFNHKLMHYGQEPVITMSLHTKAKVIFNSYFIKIHWFTLGESVNTVELTEDSAVGLTETFNESMYDRNTTISSKQITFQNLDKKEEDVWTTVYGTIIIDAKVHLNYIFEWEIEVHLEANKAIQVGILELYNHKANTKNKLTSDSNPYLDTNVNCYGVYATNLEKGYTVLDSHDESSKSADYAFEDVFTQDNANFVIMTLNVTEKTISYTINDKECGAAFTSIDMSKKYQLGLSCY